VNPHHDVAVIGAGPAGSYAAALLAADGHRLLLLERRTSDELAPRCTGVVGHPYVDLMQLNGDVVVSRARSATLVSPGGCRLRVVSPEVQAYVLDRVLLERQLRRRAAASGADVREGFAVTGVAPIEGGYEITGLTAGRRESVTCRAVVLATGVSPGLTRRLGMTPPPHHLVGAHAEVCMSGVDETEVYFVPGGTRGAFAWLVPVGLRRVRIGALCERSAVEVVHRFLDRPDMRSRLAGPPAAITQRPVPVAFPRRVYAHGVAAVGDAAGQVKPTTGGGLYLGAIGAQILAEVMGGALVSGDLSERVLREYQRRWRERFGAEMRRGALARGLYRRLSPEFIDRLLAQAGRTGLPDALLTSRSFSFDHHSGTLLAGLLRTLPGALFNRGATPGEEG
jgi:digeranylgeranylglycerophospholipid reductase